MTYESILEALNKEITANPNRQDYTVQLHIAIKALEKAKDIRNSEA